MKDAKIVMCSRETRKRRGQCLSPPTLRCYSVEDGTARIVDRVSRIAISEACSPTIASSPQAADTPSTVEEDNGGKILGGGCMMPSLETSILLASSPLRSTRGVKRKVTLVMTPIRVVEDADSTPRTCNILHQSRTKKRRPCLAIPNSPILNVTNRLWHSPIFPPFGPFDTRLDRVAAQGVVEPGNDSDSSALNAAHISNPLCKYEAPTELPPRISRSVRCRRDGLLGWSAKPTPDFPVLLPTGQGSLLLPLNL